MLAALPGAAAEDRHAGYYYPVPATVEQYTARVVTLPDASRSRRIKFVTQLSNRLTEKAYPPQFAVFAKGGQAEKLIITGLYDNAYNTVYRMRGLLATLTARARVTPLFKQLRANGNYTFLDLLSLLGFERLTVTDGAAFAHQIIIVAPPAKPAGAPPPVPAAPDRR